MWCSRGASPAISRRAATHPKQLPRRLRNTAGTAVASACTRRRPKPAFAINAVAALARHKSLNVAQRCARNADQLKRAPSKNKGASDLRERSGMEASRDVPGALRNAGRPQVQSLVRSHAMPLRDPCCVKSPIGRSRTGIYSSGSFDLWLLPQTRASPFAICGRSFYAFQTLRSFRTVAPG